MVHNHLEYPTGHSESFRKRHFLKRRRTNLEMFSYLICLWERIYLGKASLENPKWCMRTPRQHAPSIQEWRLRSSKSCAHVCNPDPCCSPARLTDGAAFTAFGEDSHLLPSLGSNNGTSHAELQFPISSLSLAGSSSRAGSPLYFSLESSIPSLGLQQPAGTKNQVWDERTSRCINCHLRYAHLMFF